MAASSMQLSLRTGSGDEGKGTLFAVKSKLHRHKKTSPEMGRGFSVNFVILTEQFQNRLAFLEHKRRRQGDTGAFPGLNPVWVAGRRV